MKKQLLVVLICFLIAGMLFPIPANADTGPKPSVRITFENMENTLCYGTLLSKTDSTGPARKWDGNEEHIWDNGLPSEIWSAFVNYKDADGYYFLQWGWQVNETHSLAWTYYPPKSFKILLYYPETDTFIVSGIYEAYAFDSYYSVDMEGIEIGSVEAQQPTLKAVKSYDYTWEIISLICRILITVLIETGIAFVFGFRQKRLLKWIVGINAATQVVLNVLLNIINYNSGSFVFVMYYVLFELIVLAAEAIVYCLVFNRVSENKISMAKILLYALVANICSFVGGFVIVLFVPGVF